MMGAGYIAAAPVIGADSRVTGVWKWDRSPLREIACTRHPRRAGKTRAGLRPGSHTPNPRGVAAAFAQGPAKVRFVAALTIPGVCGRKDCKRRSLKSPPKGAKETRMSIADWFLPKWKHSDWHVRLEAVKGLTDQGALAEIVKDDKDSSVRLAAVERLTDQNLLTDIARHDEKSHVRQAAVERVTDEKLLADIAKNCEFWRIRKAAAERVTDESLVADIAKRDEDASVLQTAVKRLVDQGLLADIARDDEDSNVRKAAMERVTDERLLAGVAKEEEKRKSRAATDDFDGLVAKLRVRGPGGSITEETIDVAKALGDLGDERAIPILKAMGRAALEGSTEAFSPSGGVRVLSGDAAASLAMQFVNAATLAIQKIEECAVGTRAESSTRPDQLYDLSAYDSPQRIIQQCKVCESRDDYAQIVALLQKLLAEFRHDVEVPAVQGRLLSALVKVRRWPEMKAICAEILRSHRQAGFPIKDHDKMYYLLLSEHRGNKPEAMDRFVKLTEEEAALLVTL